MAPVARDLRIMTCDFRFAICDLDSPVNRKSDFGELSRAAIANRKSLLVDIAAPELPIQQRDAKHHEKQRPRDGRRITQPAGFESFGVNEVTEGGGRTVGTAARQRPRRFKAALKAANHAHDDDEKRRMSQLR